MSRGLTIGFGQAPLTLPAAKGLITVAGPGANLTSTGIGVVATPTFSPAAGTYTSTQTITISCITSASTIYYTTDGSTPTFPVSGTTQQYTGTFLVTATETVKAIAIATGLLTSSIGSAAYTIAAVTFDFFIAPNGDDSNAGTLASPWSITALNSKQATYSGKKIGIIGDVVGTQTPIQHGTIGGVQTTLFSIYQAAPGNNNGMLLAINGGTSGSPTYIASCNSSGLYVAPAVGTGPWAVIDFSNPSGGAAPTVSAYAMGQNFFNGSVANPGWTTVDGIGLRYFTQAGLVFSNTGGTLNGVIVQNCEVYNGNHVIPDNNPGAISLGGCASPVITNNKVHDLQTVTGGGGSSVPWGLHALQSYSSSNMVVTHNTFYNCNSMLPKDTHQNYANCSYNYFDHGAFGSATDSGNISQGAVESLSTGSGVVSTIHHNIFLGALNLHTQDGNNMAGTVVSTHNTFFGTANHTTPFSAIQADAAVSGAALQFQFNLVYQTGSTYDHGGGYGNCLWITANIAVAGATFDNNVYGSNSNGVAFGKTFGQALSLSGWQTLTGCDPNSVLVATSPFSGTPTAQVPSSFAVNSSAIIGGVTCGAIDGSGPVGCNF